MRYVVALLVAAAVIAGLSAFAWWNWNAVERGVRQHWREQ
jgi:hypothetical protein